MRRKFISILILSLFLFTGSQAFGYVMSSSNYRMQKDSLNTGGVDQTSVTYKSKDTIGEIATDESTSSNYKLQAGFQPDFAAAVVVEEEVVGGRGGGRVKFPLTNVINFEAIAGDSQIILMWQNPLNPDFQAVRILRSTEFYPQNVQDGEVVYDGSESYFLNRGLINGVRYYYTAFAYDIRGNYASGATASAVPQGPLLPGAPPPPIPPPPPEILPPIIPPPPEIEGITLKDFDFFQEDKKISLVAENQISAKLEKTLSVALNYEKIPEVLKTIMVTLEKGAKSFSFLLKINQDKTAYAASLIPPQEAGTYPMTITILDYKNQTLKKINGQLEVKQTEPKILKTPWYQKIKNLLFSAWIEVKNFFNPVFHYLQIALKNVSE